MAYKSMAQRFADWCLIFDVAERTTERLMAELFEIDEHCEFTRDPSCPFIIKFTDGSIARVITEDNIEVVADH